MKSAIAEFQRLHAMNLGGDGRIRLLIALDSGRQRLDILRATA